MQPSFQRRGMKGVRVTDVANFRDKRLDAYITFVEVIPAGLSPYRIWVTTFLGDSCCVGKIALTFDDLVRCRGSFI